MCDYQVSNETLSKALRPFDVVTLSNGEDGVGFIKEVSVSRSQPMPEYQISYSVHWWIGKHKSAWYRACDLVSHSNVLIDIAINTCHPMGRSHEYVEKIFCSKGGLQ